MNTIDNKFLIYRSSAGSGKTFTLVQQYLYLALNSLEFKNILAITFTNKAANEMKTRVLDELAKIKKPFEDKENGMQKKLCESLGCDVITLSKKAQLLETKILHNYSDFAICTIDSFMQKIIQTFAYDLNIPLNYKVVLDNDEIRKKAINDLLSTLGNGGDTQHIVLEYARERLSEGGSWNIEKQLYSLSEYIFQEDAMIYLNRLKDISLGDFLDIYKNLKSWEKDLKNNLKIMASNVVKKIELENLNVEDFHNGNKGGVYIFLKKIVESQDKLEVHTVVQKFKDGTAMYGSSAKKDSSKIASIDKVAPLIREVIAKVEEVKRSLNSSKLILENLYTVGVLNALSEKIADYQNENEELHISEFNKKISDIVLNEPVPFLYERLGEKYQYFLIDEFQDTSVLQWQNLLPLLENSLSMGKLALVVGDGKQAIYRFRQGEVEQFVKLPDVFIPKGGMLNTSEQKSLIEERSRVLKRTSEVLNLDTNYRTEANIIEFNNDFFRRIAENSGNEKIVDIYLGEEYVEAKKTGKEGIEPLLKQKVSEKRQQEVKGYVSIEVLDYSSTEKIDDVINEKIFDTIKDLVEDKGYNFKDIAILAEKNKLLNKISNYLSGKEILGEKVPILSRESFLFVNNKEIQFLISMLGVLANPYDKCIQVVVLNYLSEKKILKESVEEYFLDKSKTRTIFSFLQDNGFSIAADELRAQTLYDCCESLVRIFSLQDKNPEYIASFLNEVASYSSENKQDIAAFYEYISKEEKKSVKTSSNLDAIEMLTIHKSKGLEYPIVITVFKKDRKNDTKNVWMDIDEKNVPDSNFASILKTLPTTLVKDKKDVGESIFSDEYIEEQKKKESDNLNKLYVALTRPKEKLFVFCEGDDSDKKKKEDKINTESTTIVDRLRNFVAVQTDAKKYTYGINDKKQNKVETKDKKETHNLKVSLNVEELISIDWNDKISISPEKTSAIEEGLRVHEVLSKIYSKNDMCSVLEQYKKVSNLTKIEYLDVENKVRQVVEGEETAMFFDPQYEVKTECEVLYKNKVRRLDRVVFMPNETWVVDFKTGEVSEKDEEQIKLYMEILTDMKYPNVRGYLYYCKSNLGVKK